MNLIFQCARFSIVLKEEMRRKNKHPKRAENAATIVVDSRVERGGGGEEGGEEEEERVLCMKIPVVGEKEMKREGDTTFRKGAKRKRACLLYTSDAADE